MEIEKKIEWLKPERVLKLTDKYKSLFGMNRLFIIGLGKNGVDCALRCKHITEKRFGTDDKKVRFLGIAQDSCLESADCEGTRLSPAESIPIVPEEAIYKYLNNPARLPQCAVDWFDSGLKNYSPATPIYGLTKRQCGRVALFHEIKNIIRVCGEALTAFAGSDKSLEIIVTGNMGDVFFGGMFIDMAYILQKLFDGSAYPVNINCYMFAPDTAVMFDSDQREQGNYFANTVITRNELDKFQCHKKPFSQKYTPTFEVISDKPPFNACFIAAAEKNYAYTLDCAAEKIISRMEILSAKDDGAERVMSYNLLRSDASHDFRYLSYGVQVCEIPLGKIMSYLCMKVFTMINHTLNKNNVGERLLGHYANIVTPDERYLAQKGGDLPALDFDDHVNPEFSVRALKNSSDGAEDYVKRWLERMEKSTQKGAEICLDEIYQSVVKVCEEAKSDFTKGPFYAEELLRKCLHQLRVSAAKITTDIEDMQEQTERAEKLARTAYMKLKTSPLFAGKAAEQYLFELHEYANSCCKLKTGDTLVKFYRDLSDKFTEYFETNLHKTAEAFECISVNRKAIFEEITRDRTEYTCAFDAISLTDEQVTAQLDKLVDEVDEELLSRAFAQSGILEIPDDDETALAAAVVNIINKCFSQFLSKSFGEFCEFFGKHDIVHFSVDSCIEGVSVAAPAADSFALNRVICPKSTRQDDIAGLRAQYNGIGYIWNGSVMNMTTAVTQIKADVQLDKFPDYIQWENMHYAYVNDSLKKHGIHIFR